MNLCVLSAADSWHFHDLKRAARKTEQISCRPFESLADFLPDASPHASPNITHPLERFDCLLTRAMPAGSLQQVVFRMDVLLKLERRGLSVINPPRAIEMAVDKYLSLTRFQEANIPSPPSAVSQQVSEAMVHFERLGGDVVLKPLFGSMGRGLQRIHSPVTAELRFAELVANHEVIYQQKFIPHRDFDLRLMVIGEQVFAMKRVNPNQWIHNLAQGATGCPYQPTEQETELAIEAARAVETQIAGVDLVIDETSGQPYVLEVNSAPSWRGISSVLQVDIARHILDFLA